MCPFPQRGYEYLQISVFAPVICVVNCNIKDENWMYSENQDCLDSGEGQYQTCLPPHLAFYLLSLHMYMYVILIVSGTLWAVCFVVQADLKLKSSSLSLPSVGIIIQ